VKVGDLFFPLWMVTEVTWDLCIPHSERVDWC